MFVSFAQCTTPNLPKRIIISDVMANDIVAFTKVRSLLTEAYLELGVDVEWVPIPTSRALLYSSRGEFDGEMVRVERVADQYPTLIKVPIPIIETGFHFYCLKESICTGNAPQSALIGYNKQIKLYEQMCEQSNWACYSFADASRLLEPLYQRKIDAFLAAGPELISELRTTGPILYQSKAVHHDVAFHYLHEKHVALKEALTALLERQLAEGKTFVPLPIRFDSKNAKRVIAVD